MSDKESPPKVVDLAGWRLKRLKLQSQEEYIRKLGERCGSCRHEGCNEDDVRRLADIQRRLILDLLGEEDEDKGPGGGGEE
jgi:hypothetical protein